MKKLITLICALTLIIGVFQAMDKTVYAAEKVNAKTSGKILKVVTTGGNPWDGIQIDLSSMGLTAGKVYTFSLDLYTPDTRIGVVLQDNKYTWFENKTYTEQEMKSPGWTTLSNTGTITADATALQFVKKGDANGGANEGANVTYYVKNFVVKDGSTTVYSSDFSNDTSKFYSCGDATLTSVEESAITAVAAPKTAAPAIEVPTTETVGMKVGGAENPWPEYSVDSHDLTLGGKPVDYTLTKTFSSLSEISVEGGDFRIHTVSPARNDYYIDNITITVGKDTKYDMQTDPKLKVGSALSSDTLGASGTITTAVVANGNAKSIAVTKRAEDWSGVIIKYTAESTKSGLKELIGTGANIVVTVKGRVVPSPIPDQVSKDSKTWLEVPSLKDTYKNDFLIGNIISSGDSPRGTENADTTKGFKYHYNVVTAENEMKPDYYGSTGLNKYSFTTPDKIVNWAKANDVVVMGHALGWHAQSPKWLNPEGTTRKQAKINMEDFIKNVAKYYDGKFNKAKPKAGGNVIGWDVLNEAHLERSTNWKSNLRTGDDGTNSSRWYAAYANGADTAAGESGADYVYDMFKYARKYAPSATLYYNDFNEDNATKSIAIANMVIDINNQWKTDPSYDKRPLIEGIGLQAHYTTNVSIKNIDASIQRFIEAGALISITELDVGTSDTSEAGLIKQAQVYAQLFQVYKKYSASIERVTFWGLNDELSWRSTNSPLLFDKYFIPKPAFYGVLDPDGYLADHPLDTAVAQPKTSIAVKGTPSMKKGVIDPIWDTTIPLHANRFVDGTNKDKMATGVFKAMWDEKNLYVLSVVTDDVVSSKNGETYKQDCVEVFFSASNSKNGAYGDFDGQYRVNHDNLYSGGGYATSKPDGFESITWPTETGYVVQMKIPFNDTGSKPALGKEIGFDCQVNDENDEGNDRNSVAVWCDISNGGAYNDTSAWGALTLVDNVNYKALIMDTSVGNATSGKPEGANVEKRLDSADWANTPTLPVLKWTTNNTTSIFGTSRATGTAQVKWDDTYLYVRVDIKDKDKNTANESNWLKDCVEIYIEDSGSNGGQSRLTYNKLVDGPVQGGSAAVKDTADGYIAYLEIPHGLTPKAGDSIKFDVQINDATKSANDRTGITTWSDSTADGYNRSENFGTLYLMNGSGSTEPSKTEKSSKVGVNSVNKK